MSKVDDAKDWLKKYGYWCLCGLVVVLSLTSWFLGTSKIEAESTANLKQIESHFDKPKGVSTKTSTLGMHPNEETNKQLVALIAETRKKVLDAWKLIYERQKNEVFVWPKNLDPEFLAWLEASAPDAEIPTKFQVDYQNKILPELKRIVKESAKATWPEKPDPLAEVSRGQLGILDEGGVPTGPPTAARSEFMIWNETDLMTYRNRYDWENRPVSLQIRLAQEDLWVLESICKVIAKVNDKFAPHERPIKVLEKLAIECFAAEERPNGVGENRVYRAPLPVVVGTGEITSMPVGGEPPPETATPTAGTGLPVVAPTLPTSKPPLRRASGNAITTSGGTIVDSAVPLTGSETPIEPPAEGTVTPGVNTKPEDVLLDWRYVNAAGVPLSKAQLDSDEYKHSLYRMMPFAIQFHIRQDGIPRLLDAFKNAALPFEIREVRINPELAKPIAPTPGSNFGFGETRTSSVGTSSVNTTLLPGEVQMEIRGVVYLAQPFDESKFGTPSSGDGAPSDQVTANP